ncbi:hypothetical protein [Actinomadura formosensis]|uniref:hypothetical protein n=1 Tax=Actinomadura formosensis TaxID=60706 RepID=UPI003D8AC93E
MTETTAGRLALAAEQLALTSERLGGITADDAPAVAAYLRALAEHGHLLCARALNAIETTAPGHPTRSASHGLDLQGALMHSSCLLDAVIHFAFEAEASTNAMTEGETAP